MPSSSGQRVPLVVALEKAEGRRRPLNLTDAVSLLRRRLGGSARVELVRSMDESMPVCEQLGWLQAANVLITPAGGVSVAAAFLQPGASVISFGVPTENHMPAETAEGSWDYDLVRLQAFGNAVRKIYAVLPGNVDSNSSDCAWNQKTHNSTEFAQSLKAEKLITRTKQQLLEHGRQALCSHHINATHLAEMVEEEIYLQRNFERFHKPPAVYHGYTRPTTFGSARSDHGKRSHVRELTAKLIATQAELEATRAEVSALRAERGQPSGPSGRSERSSRMGPDRSASTTIQGSSVAIVGPAAYVERASINIEAVVASADSVARPNVKVNATTGRLVLPKGTTRRTDLVFHSGAIEGDITKRARADVRRVSSWSALSEATAIAYAKAGVRALVLSAGQAALAARPKKKGVASTIGRAANFAAIASKLKASGQGKGMVLRQLYELEVLHACRVQVRPRQLLLSSIGRGLAILITDLLLILSIRSDPKRRPTSVRG